MKKFLSALLCALLLASLIGCNAAPSAPSAPATDPTTEPTVPAPTESEEEAKVLKIMILGSSRSVNTFQLLYEAFKDQMPEQELVLGIMYYSGCSMSMHRKFIEGNEAVYSYYRNDSGQWNISYKVTMETGLLADNWDVILLQAGTGDLENQMNQPDRIFITDYVNQRVAHPHQFWWHSTWFNSTDPDLYDPNATKLNPYTIDQHAQLSSNIETAKKTVLTDPMFEGRITSGTPMMYALKVLGIPEKELYRDHTHLSDYGCLLVAYAFYAQYTGNPVTQINLNTIAQKTRNPQYQHLGDLQVTEEMKQNILKTVDYTLKNPWSVPVAE